MDKRYNSDDELPLYESPVDESVIDKSVIDNIKEQIIGFSSELDILYRICPDCPPIFTIKEDMAYFDYFTSSKKIWKEMIMPTCKAYKTNDKDVDDPNIQLEIAKKIFQNFLINTYIFEIESLLRQKGVDTTSETIHEKINEIKKDRENDTKFQFPSKTFNNMFIMTKVEGDKIVKQIEEGKNAVERLRNEKHPSPLSKPRGFTSSILSGKFGGNKSRKPRKYRKTRKSKKYKKSIKITKSRKRIKY